MILPDHEIRRRRLIEPFEERGVAHGLTYGLGPAGYDVRIAEYIDLRTGGFVLASTIEHFFLPNDLMMRVHDKSTWARRGLFVQNTVAEPGWCGYLTLELTNHGPDIRLQRGMPIAQVVFEVLMSPTTTPYNGKYQNQQAGPQPAREDAAHDRATEIVDRLTDAGLL